jgi:hypothetical protein
MSKVEELRQTIEKLTPRERAELNALLQNWTEDDWDRQMAADSVASGKLDKLRQEAESEAKAGKLREFPKPGQR